MLLELKDSGIAVDKTMLIQNLKMNADIWQHLARIKFTMPSSGSGTTTDIDLALSWHWPKVNLKDLMRNHLNEMSSNRLLRKINPRIAPWVARDPSLDDSLEGAGISVAFDGKELLRELEFKGELKFNLMAKAIILNIQYGENKNISKKVTCIQDLLSCVKIILADGCN